MCIFTSNVCFNLPRLIVYFHREEGEKCHEIISDRMDLPVGYNSNFDLLVKDI